MSVLNHRTSDDLQVTCPVNVAVIQIHGPRRDRLHIRQEEGGALRGGGTDLHTFQTQQAGVEAAPAVDNSPTEGDQESNYQPSGTVMTALPTDPPGPKSLLGPSSHRNRNLALLSQ